MPRKPPPPPDPLSPRGIRLTIVKKLVSREALAQKGAYGRELAILAKLQAKYPAADSFWLNLKPALKLESLTYFLGTYGAASLKQEYDAWQFSQAQTNAQIDYDLDRLSILAMMASAEDASAGEAPKKRVTQLDWADGKD